MTLAIDTVNGRGLSNKTHRELLPKKAVLATLAISTDTVNGRGLSNKTHRELLPKKAKIRLYWPFILTHARTHMHTYTHTYTYTHTHTHTHTHTVWSVFKLYSIYYYSSDFLLYCLLGMYVMIVYACPERKCDTN